MIIAKSDINPDSAYKGSDFLDTLQAELSVQKSDLYTEFEQDKAHLLEVKNETEKLFLEAGKNNKILLEKEEDYKQTILGLQDKNKMLLADILELKKENGQLGEAIKQTSFKTAAEQIPQKNEKIFVLPVMKVLKSILEGYGRKQKTVIIAVDENGLFVK